MLKIIKSIFILTVLNIASILSWGILMLSGMANVLFYPIFINLPTDQERTYFMGNIMPWFIVPVLLIINFIFVAKSQLVNPENKFKYFSLNSIVILIPVFFSLISIFVLPGLPEKMLEDNVIKNFSITGEPIFILQKSAQPGFFDFGMKLPVKIASDFNGVWFPNYFEITFSPSNKEALSIISECTLDANFIGSIQPPASGKKNPPGNYYLAIQFNFHGKLCTEESFNKLKGKKLDIFQVHNRKLLKTVEINSFQVRDFLHK